MSQAFENDPFRDVVNAANHEMVDTHPGMPELIHELKFQKLGRLIVINSHPSSEPISLLGLALNEGKPTGPKTENVGYVLPLNHEQTNHLMLFANGHMYVTEANPDAAEGYMKYFAPTDAPLDVRCNTLVDAERHITKEVTSAYYINAETLISNTNPAQKEQVHAARKQAIVIAQEVKLARDNSVVETANVLVEDFDKLYHFMPQDPEAQ